VPVRDIHLLQLALGIRLARFVAISDLDNDKERHDVTLYFKAGNLFACPECNAADGLVYDTNKETWRHLEFFKHPALLTALTPLPHQLQLEGASVEHFAYAAALYSSYLHAASIEAAHRFATRIYATAIVPLCRVSRRRAPYASVQLPRKTRGRATSDSGRPCRPAGHRSDIARQSG
jgi:hypothetical protein